MSAGTDGAHDSSVPRRRIGPGLWPLALYLGLSLMLFGLPVNGHLGNRIIAADQID